MRSYLKEGKYSYSTEDFLGQGTFGKVYRGYNHLDNHWMALKQIELGKLQKYGDELKTIILSEINVMRKFEKCMKKQPCPYIVSHEDVFRTQNYIYIGMELCNGGTLEDHLKNNKLTQSQAIQILSCLSKGIQYMTKIGITHRDIKPENIFLANANIEGQQKMIFKIGDFGFADRKQDYDTAMGTLPYMAPQMFIKQKYTSQVDIWSLGVIAYELIFKGLYFMGKDKWEFQDNIKSKPFILNQTQRSLISDEYYDFTALCLIKNPNERINAGQLLSHSIFKKMQTQQKIDIFTKIYGLVEQCLNMREMAESFHIFGQQTNRKTQFIQIYLLKQAYAMVNRINYTVVYKQDYIGIPQEQFHALISDPQPYEKLSDKTQKQCIFITDLFNAKYKQFTKYVSKFSPEDQGLIGQTVDEEPYSYVNAEVFQKQISKWSQSLKQYSQWKKLQQNCQKMALIRAQSD